MRALCVAVLLAACGSSRPEPAPAPARPVDQRFAEYWQLVTRRPARKPRPAEPIETFVPFLRDRQGSWGKALRLCDEAAEKDRGDQDNAMVCALAACNIKSASKARKHMARLKSPSRKRMARQTCLKNGVDVPID
jgi:hypothetical protein